MFIYKIYYKYKYNVDWSWKINSYKYSENRNQDKSFWWKFTCYLYQNSLNKHFHEKVIHCDSVHLQSFSVDKKLICFIIIIAVLNSWLHWVRNYQLQLSGKVLSSRGYTVVLVALTIQTDPLHRHVLFVLLTIVTNHRS